jgi:hypothetical protein
MEWTEPCLLQYEFRSGVRRRPAVARLGFPKLDEVHPDEWVCSFQIKGLKDNVVHTARGADGLQALTIASAAIRETLDRQKSIDSGYLPYEIVFPRYLPFCYGLEFHRKLCKLVDTQIKEKDRELSQRRRSRRR